MMPRKRVVVLGVGNILLSDEGVGVRVVERLPLDYHLPPEVKIIDGGTCGMEMLEDLEDLDALILVDAIRGGKPPATPIRLAGDAVPVFFNTKLSPHQIGLSDVLATLELVGKAPKYTTILGIQPVSLALGMALTPEIETRMPELMRMVIDELAMIGLIAPAFANKAA
jgi:hydrogenase maturation protease